MSNMRAKLTAPIVIGIVLTVGLLAGASAALLRTPPVADDADIVEADVATPENIDGITLPAGVTMPGTETTGQTPAGEDARRDAPLGDNTPSDVVTRADFARRLAATFGLPTEATAAFADVSGHPDAGAIAAVTASGWMEPKFDGTFGPADPMTRDEVARAIVRALDLEHIADAFAPEEAIFRDVPPSHVAFAAVAMMDRLGMYPHHLGGLFVPDETVRRAEVTDLMQRVGRLEDVRGPVAHVNGDARTVSIEEAPRRAVSYVADEDSLIVRNDVTTDVAGLRVDDTARVVAETSGELLVAVAMGDDPTTSPIVGEATEILRELATPDQLAAIIARDWETAGAELKVSLYNQLLERGVTTEEADALIGQDWPAVEQHAKGRLTEAVSDNVNVEPDLVRAVLDQDWDTALEHVEVEVLEYLLNYLLETADA